MKSKDFIICEDCGEEIEIGKLKELESNNSV